MKRALQIVEAYQPVPLANVPPVTRLAFAEDALAIASWAESCGFAEDAEAMREFAAKVRPTFSATRWAHKRAVPA